MRTLEALSIVFLVWTMAGYFYLFCSFYPESDLPEWYHVIWGLNPFVQLMRFMFKRMA